MGLTQKLGTIPQVSSNYLPKSLSGSFANSLIQDDGSTTTITGASETLRLTTTGASNYFAYRNSSNTQIGDIGYDGRDTDGLSIWNNVSNGNLVFGAGAGRRMTILGSNGNVGIGTSSPSSIFEVAQTNGIITQRGNTGYSVFRSYGGDGTNSDVVEFQIRNRVDGSNMVSIGNFTSHDLTFRTGNTERMRITNGGKVLTNTTDSSGAALFAAKSSTTATTWSFGPNTVSSLDIFRIETLATTGVYLTSGNTSWTANSDERLKNITGNIENAIDALLTLRAVKYTWKKDISGKVNLGLIAQDVIKVLPEVVDINDDEDKTLGVKYTELVPVLIAAVQELSAKVSALENKS
jgi:uncharacterized protein YaiE (UPF0345 family)